MATTPCLQGLDCSNTMLGKQQPTPGSMVFEACSPISLAAESAAEPALQRQLGPQRAVSEKGPCTAYPDYHGQDTIV